jgi:hypothetical protein
MIERSPRARLALRSRYGSDVIRAKGIGVSFRQRAKATGDCIPPEVPCKWPVAAILSRALDSAAALRALAFCRG